MSATVPPRPHPNPDLVDARMSLGPAVLDDLFPEGEALYRSRRTYIVLLTLAAMIATFGLYEDSVAAIIGAMVVAPLGGAIMAMAAALVTGRLEWQPRTFVQVALGAVWVIAIGFAISIVVPNPLVLNPSIEARTQPGLFDLGVALAAGAAGAYVAVRRTGSDALPGVAIAVSLVPPLATVGICLQIGRWTDAGNALILFLTNLAAIMLAACVVFLIAGATPRISTLGDRRRLRAGIAATVIALVIVTIPLAVRSIADARQNIEANETAPIVRTWLAGTQLTVTAYKIDGDEISMELSGPDELPAVAPLAASLSKTLGHPIELTVDHILSTRAQAAAAP